MVAFSRGLDGGLGMKDVVLSSLMAVSLLAVTGCSYSETVETGTKSDAAATASPASEPAPASANPASEPAPSASPIVQKTRSGVYTATPAAIPGPNAPKLLLPLNRIDFGKQPQQRSLTRTVLIKNVGKSELHISDVQPSCGCTAVDFPRVVKPGRVGKINVKLDTGSSPGEHVKTVTIRSNDPERPSVVVDLVVNVK